MHYQIYKKSTSIESNKITKDYQYKIASNMTKPTVVLIFILQLPQFLVLYYNFMIQSFTSVNAHSRCQVYGLAFTETNKIVSIGLDSCINIWDLRDFELENSKKLKYSYLTSIYSNGQDLIVGNGEGELMFLDKSTLQTRNVVKVHDDCVNDIKVFNNQIVTASNDGTIAFTSQQNHSMMNRIQIGVPVAQIEQYKSRYYTSGTLSFEVDQELKIKKFRQSNRFLVKSGQLYGTNDAQGFACISRKYHSYVPCENMIEFNKGILGVSWSTISYFSIFEDDDRIAYNSTRIPKITQGDSISSMVSLGKRIIAGSQCGNIYTFNVNDDYHWYN